METGLYVVPGHYALAVSGRWRDHLVASPGTGASPWPVTSWPAYAVGTALDGARRLIERVTGNPRSDVVGSRRVPEARWLELVVTVADDVVDVDGTVREGTTLPIGPTGGRELVVGRGGYLYAFANDAWTGDPLQRRRGEPVGDQAPLTGTSTGRGDMSRRGCPSSE